MCLRQVTFGLVVPRKPKRLPVILRPDEIIALLQAAPSQRDKPLIGLMYATGMRVSEVVRVRWRDFDFDRRVINVWQGKGRTGRQVTLPVCYESLLSLQEVIAEINPILRGWHNYFKRSNGEPIFRCLDRFVLNRLRIFMKRKFSDESRGSRRLAGDRLDRLGLYRLSSSRISWSG